MKYVITALLLTAFTFAQTAKKPSADRRNLAKCVVDLAAMTQERDDAVKSWTTAVYEHQTLLVENKALTDANAALQKKYDDLHAAALDVLKFNNQLQEAYQKAVADRDAAADRYNYVLNQANTEISSANARLTRQAQISNALAFYSLMPKYQPIQLQLPQTVHTTFNCISNQNGNFTYTNCN